MGAVRLVFHAELRRRWRSCLAIAILISVVAGFVLAATAGGRRTASAFQRFVAAHGFDAVVYASRPVSKLPTLLVGGLAAGVIVVDNFIGIAPALAARRFKPGDLLRTPQLSAL